VADSRDLSPAHGDARSESRRRRGLALRANAPTWLRALAAFAFVRGAAIVAIAWYWIDHRDGANYHRGVIAWAVCAIAFELFAGFSLVSTAAARVSPRVAIALTALAFLLMSVALVVFAVVAVFENPPSWTIAAGIFDNVVKIPLMVGVMWPVVLARADARAALYNARSN
jgi:hypothetical protein